MTEHWWDVNLFALKVLLKIDDEKAKGGYNKILLNLLKRLILLQHLNLAKDYCLD